MHDQSYKLLFAHARMVEDLLRGFVPEAWVSDLDFATLERWNASYVSDDLRERHDDIIWRLRLRETWLYLYLLLEFQSTEDTFMAVRIPVYTGLLYQDLTRSEELGQTGKLPAVLPIVLYNGGPRWRAATDLSVLIETPPAGLLPYQLQQRYLLLDEGVYSEAELAPSRNLVAAMFRLENSRTPGDLLQILEALIDWLKTPEQTGLRRAFTVWIKRVVLRDRADDVVWERVNDLEEVQTMLADRVKEWERDWHQRGFAEGIEKGREEKLISERALLGRLANRQFGEGVANQLVELLRQINDSEQLDAIGEWIIVCQTGDELIIQTQQLLVANRNKK